MKKLLSVLLCAVMVLSLAACGKKDDAPIDDAGNGGDADGLTVALVVAGKLGDRSFYDSSKEGLDRMVADLGVTPIEMAVLGEKRSTFLPRMYTSPFVGSWMP